MNMSLTNVMHALLRREVREHRLLFLYLPAVVALLALAAFTTWLVNVPELPESIREVMEGPPPARLTPGEAQEWTRQIQLFREGRYTLVVTGMYQMAAQAMFAVFWASMAFYYLNTLYQPRKDRSILFWNSMPVSDTQTVIAKLLAGLVACQLVYMLCLAVLDSCMYVTVRIWASLSGNEGFTTYLRDNGAFSHVLSTLAMMPANLLWCLPAYGWLLLASAHARQAPFAWAAGPWVVVILAEVALSENSLVFNKIVERLLPLEFSKLNEGPYPGLQLVLGALAGAAFIYAAIRFNRADEN
jgi:ABC-2 type transport system permease protein